MPKSFVQTDLKNAYWTFPIGILLGSSPINQQKLSIQPGKRRGHLYLRQHPANQPIVNGEQIEPNNVEWGDGTLDEMYLLYTTTIDPYRPLPLKDLLPVMGSKTVGRLR